MVKNRVRAQKYPKVQWSNPCGSNGPHNLPYGKAWPWRTAQENLEDFIGYLFESKMTGFKKKLWGPLVDRFQEKGPLDLKTFETLLDLLLELKIYQWTVNLACETSSLPPQKYGLMSLLAQAQRRNKDRTDARSNRP